MADREIQRMTKSRLHGTHEHVTHIGNPNAYPPWRWPLGQVVASIDAGSDTFFIQDHSVGLRVDVGVVRPVSGKPYLRASIDGVWTDNLLAIQEY